MRKLAYLLIPLMFLIVPFVSHSEEMSAKQPAIYAVMMYADWCGSCKALDPKIEQAREEGMLDAKDVLFITLNLTDESTKLQAEKMAAALGFSEVYEDNAGKTGFMLLIDAESGEQLARITNKNNVEAITSRVQESIKSVQS